MAYPEEKLEIIQGPSKLDLMLSLFDTDMGIRIVQFQIKDLQTGWLDVQVISARRRHPSAKIWDIEGFIETRNDTKRVSIYYLSDTREGYVRFEESIRTRGIMDAPDEAKRATALIAIIEKIITTYQSIHAGNLKEDIFKLFEKAKRVHYANDRDSLSAAIKDI